MRLLALLLVFFAFPALAETPHKLNIVASFSIIADMAKEVAGDNATVTSFIPAGADAHNYEPTPADLRQLMQADLIVLNGLGLERGIEKILQSDDIKAKRIILSEGITPLLTASHEPDPHAWMNVRNAMRYVFTLRNTLMAADPAHAEQYRTRALAYLMKLDQLDAWALEQITLLPAASRRALITHNSLQYFAKAYGIEFITVLKTHMEGELSAGEMANIISIIRSQKINTVFLERGANPRLMEQLAEETGATIGGELISDSLSRSNTVGDNYISLITHDVNTIVAALRK